MGNERTLTLRVLGDAGSAVKAMFETGNAGGLLQGKLGSLGGAGALAGVGVAAGAVAAGKALFDIGSQFDEAYDHIQITTGKTGPALAGLKKDFKAVVAEVPTDFESASNAIGFVNQKLDLSGKAGRGVSEQFLELSRITKTDLSGNMSAASDALNIFDITGKKIPGTLDLMFRASQQSGMGVADIASQVASAATTLKPFGFGIEQTTALVATLGKAGLSASDVMPGLGKALATAAKDGKPAGEVLGDIFAKIKNAPDDTAAMGAAMDVFGAKAGPKLAGLVREGKLSYEEMLRTIQNGKGTIIGTGKDTQDATEKFQMLKNKGLDLIEPVAMKVFNAVGKIADGFNNLSPGMQKAILIAVAVVGVLGGIAAAVVLLGPVFAAVGAVIAVAIGIITSPITLVAVAVVALAFLFVKNFDTIKGAVMGVVDWVRNNWPLLLAILTGPIGLAVLFIKDHFGDIVSFVKGVPGKISGAAHGMWDGISGGFKTAINTIIRGWNNLEFKVPGFGVGPVHFGGFTLGMPNIPMLAKGGTATSAGWSVVGDDGPELRYMPEGASVVPLDRALGAGGGGDGGPLTVVLELDGREVGRVVTPHVRTNLLRVKLRNGDTLGLA